MGEHGYSLRDARVYKNPGARKTRENCSGPPRNLMRAGIPEAVSMTLIGHKTRSVFDRLNIGSPTDLPEATRKMADEHNVGHSVR